MLFFTSLAEIPADFGPSAVTIGKFDGLHTGHRRVLRAVHEAADVAGTRLHGAHLRPQPAERPGARDGAPRRWSATAEARTAGGCRNRRDSDAHFDRAFSTQRREQFVQNILVDALHASIVFVGADFRFGAHGPERGAAAATRAGARVPGARRRGDEPRRHPSGLRHQDQGTADSWRRRRRGASAGPSACRARHRRPRRTAGTRARFPHG